MAQCQPARPTQWCGLGMDSVHRGQGDRTAFTLHVGTWTTSANAKQERPTPGLGCLASQGRLDSGQALGGSLGTWKRGRSFLPGGRKISGKSPSSSDVTYENLFR